MKKDIALLALGKLAPKGKDDPEGDYEDDGNEGVQMAMEDFLASFKSEDPKGMAAAFENAVYMCKSGDHEPVGG